MNEDIRLLAINCPAIDKGGFKGLPTSLLYALGPLIEEIKEKPKKIPISGFSHLNIFDPTYYDKDTDEELIKCTRFIIPHIVAISATSDSFHIAVHMARIIKEDKDTKDTIVILGGPHCDEVDFNSRDNNNPLVISNDIDFAIAGDGEYMLLHLVRNIIEAIQSSQSRRLDITAIKEFVRNRDTAYKDVKGEAKLYFKVNDRIEVVSSSMEQLQLDIIPSLKFSYLREEHLKDFNIFYELIGDTKKIKKCVQVLTHRGCSSICNFCSERVLSYDKTSLYYNSSKTVRRIVSEIEEYIDNLGIEAVFFDDSTFMENNDFIKELCKEFIDGDLFKKINWGCLNRYDVVNNAEIIELMRQAGLDYMYIGLESCNEKDLAAMNKIRHREMTAAELPIIEETQIQKIQNAINLLYEKEIRVGVSILFGHPFASERGEKETIEFVGNLVEENKVVLVSLSLFNYHLASAVSIVQQQQLALDYYHVADKVALQNTPPWSCFEEGGWFHAINRNIDEEYLSRLLWEVAIHIKNKDVLVRRREFEEFLKSSWAEKAKEAPEAYTLVSNFPDFQLSQYEIVKHYVRADKELRKRLRNVATKIVDGMSDTSRKREHYLLWGPSGSGKTAFCEKVAEANEIDFNSIDLTNYKLTPEILSSNLNKLIEGGKPNICLIDEVGANEKITWAYETIKFLLDCISSNNLPITYILAGSKGENIGGLEKIIIGNSREKRHLGQDMLRRITNRCEIPQVTNADKLVVFCSNIMKEANSIKKTIDMVEKRVLYYILLDPRLHSASELTDLAGAAVSRTAKKSNRLIYQDIFDEMDDEVTKFGEHPKHRDNLNALKETYIRLLD